MGGLTDQRKILSSEKPKAYAELETFENGHTYECFHNLDIEVININAEIKALHYSAHLFLKKLKSKQNCFLSFRTLLTLKVKDT